MASIADAYLAKDNGAGNAGDRSTTFLPTDIPIYCVVELESAVPATVKMNLLAENVAGVKPDTNIVSTSYTTKDDENIVNFNGRPAGKWVPGKYRAEIYVNGKLGMSLSFEIQGPTKQPAAARTLQPVTRKAVKPAAAARPRKKGSAPFTASVVNR